MGFKPLPIGVESFEDLISNEYYYVDKTLLIKDLIDYKGKVNLFTRPRRFGKTLNLSMLEYYYEKKHEDFSFLFSGLLISKAGNRYMQHQGQYPLITLSLKSGKQKDWALSLNSIKKQIAKEFERHAFILSNNKLTTKKERYLRIQNVQGFDDDYIDALLFLSECLYIYYEKKVIILIDEYDVPLENAYLRDFYEDMSIFIRSLFESALKTNEYLEFAVITGCLRISKESIFTGLNHFEINSITNEFYAEHFGFTENEVVQMLKFYGIEKQKDIVKDWYDGYTIGAFEIYNPWSLINYVKALNKNLNAYPVPYWSNTSSNDIVKTLIERADISTKGEIETLIEGKSIEKPIYEDITYEDIDKTKDNLWNFLFFTGYLKKVKETLVGDIKYFSLAIPNREIRYIYKNTILHWFDEKINRQDLSSLYEAFLTNNLTVLEETISFQLQETISFYDFQEDFYHGFLLGLLKNMKQYIVISNRESGNGRPDIIIKSPTVRGVAMILEFKVTREFSQLEDTCQKALNQIEDKKYDQSLIHDGYEKILKYGISFCKKECKVKSSE